MIYGAIPGAATPRVGCRLTRNAVRNAALAGVPLDSSSGGK